MAGGGAINGVDGMFTTSSKNLSGDHSDGDLMPSDPGALPQGGGLGPVGNTVDGISCDVSMSNNYHVHAFVGIYYNGTEVALPDAIGIVNSHGESPPGPQTDGWSNQEIYGDCFYHIHTHDESGIVHMEDPNPTGAPITTSIFTVGNLLDIWGVSVTANSFGTLNGPVTVYTSGQFARGPCSGAPGSCEVGSTNYTQWTGDPTGRDIPLYSHEVIWYVIGSGPAGGTPSHLPGINFDVTQ